MKIEILYPEYANLFGDMGNILYLKACLPQAEFIETPMNSAPRFLTEPIDLIYMGPMSEPAQEKAIQRLMPYKEQLAGLIAGGTHFLFTGNAVETLFQEIEDNGRKIPGLGLFSLTAKRSYLHRHNSNFLGGFQGMEVLGCKSQFTMAYGDNSQNYFAKAQRGIGLNRDTPLEGIRQNHFIGTYLIGPLLVMNPPFTRWLLDSIGAKDAPLAYEDAMKQAYAQRLKEFKDPAVRMEKEGDTNQLKIDFSPKSWYNILKSKMRRG